MSEHDPGQFPDTPWSLIAAGVGDDNDVARDALRELLTLYWEPVFFHIQSALDCDEGRATALCEDYFVELLYGATLSESLTGTSRFRNVLRDSLDQFLALESPGGSGSRRSGVAINPDKLHSSRSEADSFDEHWTLITFKRALDVLRERYTDAPEKFSLFEAVDVDGEALDSASLAQRFEIEPAQLVPTLRELRRAFRRQVTAAVYQYVNDQSAVLGELRWLLGQSEAAADESDAAS
ncbi:MAG: hypothetical protein AAGH76_01310 [Pseudomonadota bacterium]